MRRIIVDFTKHQEDIEVEEDTEVFGVYVGRNSSVASARLKITHKKPGLKSRINIKSIVFDQARFDLEANVLIEQGASLTDTYLKLDSLIMSDQAFVRAVPSLEIKEDDVKGGHGATVGNIDEKQLHYVQAKGLDRKTAEAMLVDAFLGEFRDLVNIQL